MSAIDKQLDTGVAVFTTQTGMVGRAFVTKMLVIRQVLMMVEVTFVAEHRLQDTTAGLRLQRTMEFIGQVGRRKVHFTVGRVCARRYRCRIGGPHTGRGTNRLKDGWSLCGRFVQHFGVGAGKADPAQCINVRTFLRRQHTLLHTHVVQRFHFLQSL